MVSFRYETENMLPKLSIIICCIFVASNVSSQHQWLLGAHGGLDVDNHTMLEPNELIGQTPITSYSGGVIISYEIAKNFSFESGISHKTYNKGYGVFTGERFGNFQSKTPNPLQFLEYLLV